MNWKTNTLVALAIGIMMLAFGANPVFAQGEVPVQIGNEEDVIEATYGFNVWAVVNLENEEFLIEVQLTDEGDMEYDLAVEKMYLAYNEMQTACKNSKTLYISNRAEWASTRGLGGLESPLSCAEFIEKWGGKVISEIPNDLLAELFSYRMKGYEIGNYFSDPILVIDYDPTRVDDEGNVASHGRVVGTIPRAKFMPDTNDPCFAESLEAIGWEGDLDKIFLYLDAYAPETRDIRDLARQYAWSDLGADAPEILDLCGGTSFKEIPLTEVQASGHITVTKSRDSFLVDFGWNKFRIHTDDQDCTEFPGMFPGKIAMEYFLNGKWYPMATMERGVLFQVNDWRWNEESQISETAYISVDENGIHFYEVIRDNWSANYNRPSFVFYASVDGLGPRFVYDPNQMSIYTIDGTALTTHGVTLLGEIDFQFSEERGYFWEYRPYDIAVEEGWVPEDLK